MINWRLTAIVTLVASAAVLLGVSFLLDAQRPARAAQADDAARHLIDTAFPIDMPAPNDGVLAPSGPCLLGGILVFDSPRPVVVLNTWMGEDAVFIDARAGRTRSGPPFEELGAEQNAFALREPFHDTSALRRIVSNERARIGDEPVCIVLRPDLDLRAGDVYAMGNALRRTPDADVVIDSQGGV